MYYKLAQLVLTPGRRSQTVSEIYLAQPDSIKESLAGKLFILIEVEQNNSDGLKIINFLIDNISNNYYQNEKIYLREKISSLKVEHIFEASLAKTNKNFQEYLEKEKIKINPRLINATVGVLHENMIHVANTGKNKAFLVYKSNSDAESKDSSDEQSFYKIIDIARDEKSKKNKADCQSEKFFSNVVSGQMPEKGIFIFANEALPEYISSKQLIQIATTLPPLSAVEQIKNMLTRINSYVSFLGIIVKSTAAEKNEEESQSAIISTQNSIENLNRTEESTENFLAPTGVINSKKILAGIFTKIFKPGGNQTPTASNKVSLKDKIFVKKKRFIFLEKIWQTIKDFGIHLINIFFFVLKSLTSREKFSELKSQSKEQTNNLLTNLKTSLFSLNNKSRTLLIVAAACFGIFIISVSYSGYSSKQEALKQAYTDLVAQIEQKQNQTDAFLIYNNEDGTRLILKEIEDLLKNFPQDSEEQKNKYQEIKRSVEGQLEKVRKIIKIDDSQEIANFFNLNSNAQPQNLAFLPELNKIYAGDSNQKTIYIVDLKQNLITPITGFSQTISALSFPMVTKEKNIYYLNNNNITIFDASTEQLNNNPIELKTELDKIANADVYNNNVYLLAAQDNKIYKYDKSGNGFLAPKNWLSEDVDLADSVDLEIDGNIYVLKKNGEIIKLLKGKAQTFNIERIDPEIEQATKMSLLPDQNFIYILEPEKKRLTVFNKEGQLIRQYQSDQWQDLRDLAVDEKNKIIYLLNGSSLIKFTAQHIK